MALTLSPSAEKRQLNPTAPEFLPSQVAAALPPPPPPPFPYFPPPPTTVYYYHYHRHLHFISSPKFSFPNHNYFPYIMPQSNLIMLPPADDGLGLITSPTSSPSPPKPANPLPKPTHRARGPTHSGRIRNRFGRSSRTCSSLNWVKKNSQLTTTTAPDDAQDAVVDPSLATPTPISTYLFGASTSLMIRNIPVRLRRAELMGMLDDHCRLQNEKLSPSSDEPPSQFDFLYLPIDFKRKGNKGYAFVNFTSWQAASRLCNSWDGTTWENCRYLTSKICKISPAKFQGNELKEHFERSVFECETDDFLPVKLSPPRDGSNAEVTEIITIGKRIYGRFIAAT